MLVACFAIKIFGGNWFEVVCTNEHFLKICDFIEGNPFVYVPLSFFVYVLPATFIMLSVCKTPKPNKNKLLTIVVCMGFLWACSWFAESIKPILEIVLICVLPIVVGLMCEKKPTAKEVIKKNWYRGILANVLIFIFQLLSLLTKNIGIKTLNDNLVLTYMFLIDYYIMATLFYLNTLEKEI